MLQGAGDTAVPETGQVTDAKYREAPWLLFYIGLFHEEK